MRATAFVVFTSALLSLGGCGLKAPNPDLEAERMAVEACTQQAHGNFLGSSYVNVDVCMEQYGYTREQRKTVW